MKFLTKKSLFRSRAIYLILMLFAQLLFINTTKSNENKLMDFGCVYADFSFEIGADGSVSFTDASSSANGDIVSWIWNFGDGGTGDETNPTHYYNIPNTNLSEICFSVTLEAVDLDGTIGSVTKQVCIPISINTGELVAEITSCPLGAGVDQSVTFSGEASGGTPPYTYEWDFDEFSSPSIDDATGSGPHSVIYADPGSVTIFLTVTDAQGYTDIESCQIEVGSNPGISTISTSGLMCIENPIYFEVDLPAPYDFSGIVTYDWDFGDGNTAQYAGPYWEHTYTAPGDYNVTFTIYDSYGSYSYSTVVAIGNCVDPPASPFILNVNDQSGNIIINPGDPLSVDFEVVPTGNEDPNDWCFTIQIANNFSGQNKLYDEYDILINNQVISHTFDEWYACNFVWLTMKRRQTTGQNAGDCTPNTDYQVIDYPCYVRVEVAPLEILDIEIITSDASDCAPGVKVNAINGLRKAGSTSSQCNEVSYYKDYLWKAYDINNPSIEVESQFPNDPSFFTFEDQKCTGINLAHPYFDQFGSGDIPVFIAQVGVSDYENNLVEYNEIVYIEDEPLTINLDDHYTICSGPDDFPLIDPNESLVLGGNADNVTLTSIGNNNACLLLEEGCALDNNPVPIFVSDPIPDTYTLLVHATDGNCVATKLITIEVVADLNVSLAENNTLMCNGGGEFDQLFPDVWGGSGEYIYSWEPANYFDDPSAQNPKVIPPIGALVGNLTLTITDVNGGCTASDNLSVTFLQTYPQADAGDLTTVCYGDPVQIGGNPTGSGATNLIYDWTSDHPNFTGSSSANPVLTESITRVPGTYIFEVKVIDLLNGCFDIDQTEVTILDQWTYEGYESNLYPLIAGGKGKIWDKNTTNNLLSEFTPPLNFSWISSGGIQPYNVNLSSNGIPAIPNVLTSSVGRFYPTVYDPYLSLLIKDVNGCTMDFATNRYLLVDAMPEANIFGNFDSSPCVGEETCFSVVVNSNFIGKESWLLPHTLDVNYLRTSHGGNVTQDQGVLTLQLINGEDGIYEGEFCFTPNQHTGNPLNAENFSISGSFMDELNFEADYNFIINWNQSVPLEHPFCEVLPSGNNNSYVANATKIVAQPFGNCLGCILNPDSWVVLSGGSDGYVILQNESNFLVNEGGYLHALIDPCAYSNFTGGNSTSIQKSPKENQLESTTSKTKELGPEGSKNSLELIPNPFNNEVQINFELNLESPANVSLYLTDVLGHRQIVVFENRMLSAGKYSNNFDGSKLEAGVYYYELIVDKERIVKKGIKVN